MDEVAGQKVAEMFPNLLPAEDDGCSDGKWNQKLANLTLTITNIALI